MINETITVPITLRFDLNLIIGSVTIRKDHIKYFPEGVLSVAYIPEDGKPNQAKDVLHFGLIDSENYCIAHKQMIKQGTFDVQKSHIDKSGKKIIDKVDLKYLTTNIDNIKPLNPPKTDER